MKKLFSQKTIGIDPRKLQDNIFLVGIFIFTTILIIGLFPEKDSQIIIWKDYIVYAFMTAPVIAAIYFIFSSFQQKLYNPRIAYKSSLRKKMALAFVFVAILPTLLVVLVSNNFINRAFDSLISEKITNALRETVRSVDEPFRLLKTRIDEEIQSLQYKSNVGMLNLRDQSSRRKFIQAFKIKSIETTILTSNPHSSPKIVNTSNWVFSQELAKFYSHIKTPEKGRIDRLNLDYKDYICASIPMQGFIVVLFRNLPAKMAERQELITGAFKDYERLEYLKVYFRNSFGVFLLGLSIIIIFISFLISLYLSKTITRPILRLADAAQDVSSRNFDVQITPTTEDEIGFLFETFNQMVSELKHSSKIYYQKQRLEAWRDMARHLVHEIKNPLTPIRLSAERMRKRFLEKHKDIDKIIVSGTDTIIEEVKVLTSILSDFTQFARLPEMKPGKVNLNKLLSSCADFFSGHEGVEFILDLDERIGDIQLDKILMRQAIINLLHNSVDAVEMHGEIKIESRMTTVIQHPNVLIRISDNGVGIEKYELDHIFEPGFSTKFTGTGLGLAIVEKIIFEHDGLITCSSVVGIGTEFIIELPVSAEED